MKFFPFDKEINLSNDVAHLKPLKTEHLNSLNDFVIQEPRLFDFALQPMQTKEDLGKYILHAIDQRIMKLEYPFLVMDQRSGKVAGTTRFYQIDQQNETLAIGYTWIGNEFQGTGLNRTMKLLMLNYAFDEAKFTRVEFRVDSRNEKSIVSLKKLGAQNEGVLRSHVFTATGFRRDTIVFSILNHEFELVKNRLLNG